MNNRRICIVQLGRIGDLLLVTPMFRALKLANPADELHLLAGRNNYRVAVGNPYVDRIHVHTKRLWGSLRLILMLRATRFDAWIDPKEHRSTESALFARLARAPVKVGYRGSRAFTHPSCEQKAGGEHFAVRSLRNIEILGVKASDVRPVVPPSPEEDEVFRRFRADRRIDRYCGVNISATHSDRDWGAQHWTEALASLADTGLSFIITAAPPDRNRAEEIARRAPGCHAYGTGSVRGVFPLVRNALLVLSVDTAIVHIASAFNTPIVALYGNLPANYCQFHPLSDRFRSVMHPDPGAPVGRISVAQVTGAFRSLLREIRA